MAPNISCKSASPRVLLLEGLAFARTLCQPQRARVAEVEDTAAGVAEVLVLLGRGVRGLGLLGVEEIQRENHLQVELNPMGLRQRGKVGWKS